MQITAIAIKEREVQRSVPLIRYVNNFSAIVANANVETDHSSISGILGSICHFPAEMVLKSTAICFWHDPAPLVHSENDRDEHIEAGSRKTRSAFSTVIPEDSLKVLGVLGDWVGCAACFYKTLTQN